MDQKKFIRFNFLLILFLINITLNSFAHTDFDYTKLPIMDFYSQPNIVTDSSYSVDNNWNEFNYGVNRRERRIEKLRERIFKDFEEFHGLPPVGDSYPLCGNAAKRFFFDFTGVENFENYLGYDDNYDGISEGYDYYSPYVQNGKENIPLYMVATKTKNPNDNTYHWMLCVFIGPENDEEKDNPLDFNQWYIFNNNGEQVQPGDYFMDENGPATIYSMAWDQDWDGNYSHDLIQLIPFQLTNGIASYPGDDYMSPNFLRQNPHRLFLKFNSGNDTIKTFDLGVEDIFKNPLYETNADPKYTEISLKEKMDTSYINEVEYYLTKTISGKTNQVTNSFLYGKSVRENYGRWFIGDTIIQTAEIRDLSPPEFVASTQSIGYNTNYLEITPTNFGVPIVTDNSGRFTLQYMGSELAYQTDSTKIYQLNFKATDWKGQNSEGYKEIIEEKDITPPKMKSKLYPDTIKYVQDESNINPDSIGWPTATDDSGMPVKIIFNGYRLYKEEPTKNSYYLDFTFEDWAGNKTVSFTRVVAIKSNSTDFLEKLIGIKFYPNPVNNFLNVQNLPGYETTFPWKIISATGKLIAVGWQTDLEFRIDVSWLQNGLYFLKIGKEGKYIIKFIKE
jgi:hypothetical protein